MSAIPAGDKPDTIERVKSILGIIAIVGSMLGAAGGLVWKISSEFTAVQDTLQGMARKLDSHWKLIKRTDGRVSDLKQAYEKVYGPLPMHKEEEDRPPDE